MKKKASLVTVLSISSLVGMAIQAHAGQPDEVTYPQAQQRFSNLVAHGNIKISVIPKAPMTREYFSIQEPHGSHVRVSLHDHTLFLSQTGTNAKPAVVRVHVNQLNDITLYNQTSLIATNLHSHHLNLDSHTSGSVTINGMVTLDALSATGCGNISIAWVRGHNVSLDAAGHSHITLAGNVDTVRAKLTGHSFLNAKYLRAQNTWIQSTQLAQAEVTTSGALQAYPSGSSNIYYYKTPQLLNAMTSHAGNTLQLGWNR